MVPIDALINAVRGCGYKFKRQAPRVQIYKRRGSTHRISIPRRSTVSVEYAQTILRSIDMPEDEIRAFLAETQRRGDRMRSREIELAPPSCQPSKAEKEAPIEFPEGTTPDDLVRALMQPARVRYVPRPRPPRG